MNEKKHFYQICLEWTGNTGQGTKNYEAYQRSHSISIQHKVTIDGSSDPAFRGDKKKHNPEELFLSSIASCHMLWYLHLCAMAGIVVLDYLDTAEGLMQETSDGGGRFVEVILKPEVTINDHNQIDTANLLHAEANRLCYIANSCNFPILHEPKCKVR